MPDAGIELEIVFRGEALVKAGVFEQRSGAGPDLAGVRSSVEAENLGAAGGRLEKAQQHPNGGGLTGPVRAKETEDGAGFHLERESIDGAHGREVARQGLGADGNVGHSGRGSLQAGAQLFAGDEFLEDGQDLLAIAVEALEDSRKDGS